MLEYKAPCGCHIWIELNAQDTPGQTLNFCPLHDAAGEMLEALKCAQDWMDQVSTPTNEGDWQYAVEKINAAIAKAERKNG